MEDKKRERQEYGTSVVMENKKRERQKLKRIQCQNIGREKDRNNKGYSARIQEERKTEIKKTRPQLVSEA